MLHQYHAQRRQGGFNPHGIGTIPIGSIVYLQDGVRPMGRLSQYASVVRKAPWIVMAWHNREYHPAMVNQPATTYMSGGHLATVRCLRTGRECRVADWFLRWHDDNGLLN
jgi:hypothetical protein